MKEPSLLEHCQRAERLSLIRGGGKMSKLKTTIGDYREVEILPDSVIYADIPYKFSRGYGADEHFDHEAFYNWCKKQTALVLLTRFEKVYVPKGQLEMYKQNKLTKCN